MGTRLAGAPALDAYLHQSFDLIQYVADNMGAIKAVADHLTPVEDLVDFKATIDELHGKLGLLVEASELLIQTTPAGIQLLLAPDAPAQRLVMGLGTASVKDVSYFAKTTDFDMLSLYVEEIDGVVDDLVRRVVALEAQPAFIELSDTVKDILKGLNDGTFTAGLGTQVADIEVRVGDAETTLQGQASAITGLTADVIVNKQGILATAQSLTALESAVGSVQGQITANSTAVAALSTRAGFVDGELSAQSQNLVTLTSQAANLANEVAAQASATQALATAVGNTAAGQTSLSNAVTVLANQVADTALGITANAQAIDSLTSSVASTGDTLTAAAESITRLEASVTGMGNLLSNAGFQVGSRDWTLFSRGAGWLAAQLSTDMEPARLPQGVHALSLTANGVPSGSAGIKSLPLAVSRQVRYMLSGYLAAENCTVELQWRLFNLVGEQIGYGLAGTATNRSPSLNLADWLRVHAPFTVSVDGATVEIQLWVSNCNTAPPKIWFLRPQLEEVSVAQTAPSPWVEGVSGMESALAGAMHALTTHVDETLETIIAQSQDITTLATRVGGLTILEATTHSGSGDYAATGAPFPPSLRYVNGPPLITFERGLTLVQFTEDGAVKSARQFDTYSSNTARLDLVAALVALTPQDTFLLVSQNNHGIKLPALTSAMEMCGASAFANISGSTPYALRGAGRIGKGNGIEVYPNSENQYIDFTFTLANGKVMGLGELALMASQVDAIEALTTRIEASEDGFVSTSSKVVELSAQLVDTEAGLRAERAAREAALTITRDELASIMSNNVLTPPEKSALVREYQALLDEKPGIVAEAVAAGIEEKKLDYLAALGNLGVYLETLLVPTKWDDMSGNTLLT